VKCSKDEEGKDLVQEKDIKYEWKNYFQNFFNEGYEILTNVNMLNIREEDQNYNCYGQIREHEIKEALKSMNNGKEVGPNNIDNEVWKSLGDRGIRWLTQLSNEIMRSKQMSDEWRRSTLVQIFKNKRDTGYCANYKGIKLINHTLKL